MSMPEAPFSLAASDVAREMASILNMAIPNRPLLVVNVGLPRSGKTTWSKLTKWTVVSPDAMRLAFQGRPFIQETEPWIWSMIRIMVKSLFIAGNEQVVLDGTFITANHRRAFHSCDLWDTIFNVFKVPEAECHRRADVDGRPELHEVITRMSQDWEPVSPSEGLCYPSLDSQIHWFP